jgi:hypothetical protein
MMTPPLTFVKVDKVGLGFIPKIPNRTPSAGRTINKMILMSKANLLRISRLGARW